MAFVGPRRRALLVALPPLVLWPLVACAASSAGDPDDSASTTTATEALLVCSDVPYEPFEFERDGELVGYDVDLVDAVAERLGRQARVVATPLDQFPAALDAGSCQLVASALPIPDPGSTTLVFSDPYLDIAQALLVKSPDAGRLSSMAATAGATVGVVTDSPSADFAEAALPPDTVVVPFPTIDDAVAALVGDEIDAVVADSPLARYAARDDGTLAITEEQPTPIRYGLATDGARAPLLTPVNAALAELRSDGTLDELSRTWFEG